MPSHQSNGAINRDRKQDVEQVMRSLEAEVQRLSDLVESLEDENSSLPLLMKDWSQKDVCKWFRVLGFGNYINSLSIMKINGEKLQKMAFDECAKLGIAEVDLEKLRVLVRCYMLEAGEDVSFSKRSVNLSVSTCALGNKENEDNEDDLMSQLEIELISSDPNECVDQPSDGDIVKVHYVLFIQGKNGEKVEIENSRAMVKKEEIIVYNQPLEWVCGCDQVIKGWDLAIKTFEGQSRKLITIPPSLAYGEEGHLPGIPSNATLVCDIELIDIEHCN